MGSRGIFVGLIVLIGVRGVLCRVSRGSGGFFAGICNSLSGLDKHIFSFRVHTHCPVLKIITINLGQGHLL